MHRGLVLHLKVLDDNERVHLTDGFCISFELALQYLKSERPDDLPVLVSCLLKLLMSVLPFLHGVIKDIVSLGGLRALDLRRGGTARHLF